MSTSRIVLVGSDWHIDLAGFNADIGCAPLRYDPVDLTTPRGLDLTLRVSGRVHQHRLTPFEKYLCDLNAVTASRHHCAVIVEDGVFNGCFMRDRDIDHPFYPRSMLNLYGTDHYYPPPDAIARAEFYIEAMSFTRK